MERSESTYTNYILCKTGLYGLTDLNVQLTLHIFALSYLPTNLTHLVLYIIHIN